MINNRKLLSYRHLFLIAFGVFAGLAVALPAQAGLFGDGKDPGWIVFLGRLHMVTLHLPIGILIAAFVIELMGVFRRSRGFDVAASRLLILGAISAFVACLFGWFLEETNGAAETATFSWHKWLGISLFIIATIAAVLKTMSVSRQWRHDEEAMSPGGLPLMLARLGLVAIMVLLPVTGHLGGNMVHGPTYLTEKSPIKIADSLVYWPEKIDPQSTTLVEGGAAPDDGSSIAVWNESIQPILDEKCVSCHGVSKDKGDLRLDTLAMAMKGGSLGFTIVPGNYVRSELYVRVALPHDDDEIMPPSSKHEPLSDDEIHRLATWIRDFDGNLDGGTPAPAEGQSVAQRPTGRDKPAGTQTPTYDPALARQIENAGAAVQALSQEQDPDQMVVRFAYRSTPLDKGALKALDPAADSIAKLELQGSVVTDNDLADLPAMSKLTYLNLKDTGITDAGLANLPEMPKLEWINLFGTQITDEGLVTLGRFASLKKVYLTGTGVTESAVATLRTTLPDAVVYADFDLDTTFSSTLAPSTFEEGQPEATAPVNTKCPVSGADVNAEFTSVYEDKTVAFCCGNCKAKFDENPAAYADKLAAAAPQPATPVNTKCPVSGADIDPAMTVTYEGKLVAFCCGNCKAKFEADPASFAAKLP